MPRGGGHCGRWRLDRRGHAGGGPVPPRPPRRGAPRGYPSGTNRSAGRRWAIRRPPRQPPRHLPAHRLFHQSPVSPVTDRNRRPGLLSPAPHLRRDGWLSRDPPDGGCGILHTPQAMRHHCLSPPCRDRLGPEMGAGGSCPDGPADVDAAAPVLLWGTPRPPPPVVLRPPPTERMTLLSPLALAAVWARSLRP